MPLPSRASTTTMKRAPPAAFLTLFFLVFLRLLIGLVWGSVTVSLLLFVCFMIPPSDGPHGWHSFPFASSVSHVSINVRIISWLVSVTYPNKEWEADKNIEIPPTTVTSASNTGVAVASNVSHWQRRRLSRRYPKTTVAVNISKLLLSVQWSTLLCCRARSFF